MRAANGRLSLKGISSESKVAIGTVCILLVFGLMQMSKPSPAGGMYNPAMPEPSSKLQTILCRTVKEALPTLHHQAAQQAATANSESADDVIGLTTGAALQFPAPPAESHTAALPAGIITAYSALGSSTTADDVAGVSSSIPSSSTVADGSVPGGLWNVLESTAGSSHQVVETGQLEAHNVLLFNNLIMFRGRLWYLTEVEVLIEKFETSWRDVDGLKWVEITQISKAKFMEEVMKDRAPQMQPITIVEMQQAAFWYFETAQNYGHDLSEYAPSLHNIMCKHLGRCVYEPDAATWQDLWVLRLDPIGLAATKPFPEAIQELWRCFSTHPVLYLSHEYFYEKVVVIWKSIAGIGPDCRAFSWCHREVFHRKPMAKEHMISFRQRLGTCLGFNPEMRAPLTPPRIILVDRAWEDGRHISNRHSVEHHLRSNNVGAEVEIALMNGLSLRQQMAVYANATILLQVHGASMASWMYLPHGSAVIHIIPYKGYEDLHHWAQHLVADLPQAVGLVEYTPRRTSRTVLNRKMVMEHPVYQAMTTEQRLILWEHSECPSEPADFSIQCSQDMFVRCVDVELDLQQLAEAMRSAWDFVLPPHLNESVLNSGNVAKYTLL